jgi:hypothetical protein
MASVRTFRGSFVGGELSPEMFGRLDDSKFQNGAASIQNMIATSLGPAEKRPGFAFVATTKGNGTARLLPFTYSTTQTVVIEVGAGYFRFHTQGQTLQYAPPAAWATGILYAVGDLVAYGGVNYYSTTATFSGDFAADLAAGDWYALPADLTYEVPNPYAAADLFGIHYVQSADVLTLVHPNYPPAELDRRGATEWTYAAIAFGQTLAAPTGVAVTPTLGYAAVFAGVSSGAGGQALFTTVANHTLALGDGVYIIPPTGSGGLSGFYLVEAVPFDGSGDLIPNELYLMDYSGNPVMYGAAALATVGGTVQYGTQIVDITNTYVVSAIAADGIQQSPTSAPVSALNNLYVTGSFNTITWDAVPGAYTYYVFKEKFGLYGFIGQTSATSLDFADTNIAVDMSITPDINDPEFGSAGNYPGAVGYCQQRRVFAGTNDAPQNLWMTKTGTESDLSYSLPVQDSDRIAIAIAAREQSTILHIIPLLELILLTSSCEISASPSAGAVITPSTISANPQSYVGATNVQPTVVNNQALFCAARGGHVRELGYQWQIGGYVTGDVSLRAAHLFDGFSIVDQAFMKAAWQAVWFVSSSGNLLGFTYIPEEGVGAWHHHVTDGQFRSVAVVAEGAEDHLYAIVARPINGQTVNCIERMNSRIYGEPVNPYAPNRAFYVDCGASFDGTNDSEITMTVTGGSTWGPADTLTLYASAAAFVDTDPGSVVVLTGSDGVTLYRFTVKNYLNATAVVGVIDKVLEVNLQSTATAVWAWARPIIEGLTWLVGKTVNVLVDGAVQPSCVVQADGSITLQRPGVVVQAGLPYTAEIDTLPITLQTPGFGQGTQKNINKVWVKLYNSGSVFIGPSGGSAVEFKQRTTEAYGAPAELMTKEIELTIPPSWGTDGRFSITQSNPLPLTVVGITAEVSVGG